MMRNFKLIALALLGIVILSCSTSEKETLLTAENWVVEQQDGGVVKFENNEMEIIDAKGCTVWLNKEISGPVIISYEAFVVDNGGEFDRVSDLNCFWMAQDPKNQENFFKDSEQRAGKFLNYNELNLYYVGYGGHNNTKTRFRRYNGEYDRPLNPEHDLAGEKFRIQANTPIKIELICNEDLVQYKRNGEVIFELKDVEPYTKGYFGIRTVNNHMFIRNLKITPIE